MVINYTPDEIERLTAVAFDTKNGVLPSELDLARFAADIVIGLVQDYEEVVGQRLVPDVSSEKAAISIGRQCLKDALLNAQKAE